MNFEKPTDVGKLHLLPNKHKRFIDLLGHPVILSSGTLIENVSKFLDHHLQPVMKEEKYCTYRLNLGEKTERAILVTTDMVGIYPSISHIEGLEFFANSMISLLTQDIIKKAENFLEKVFLSLISSFSNKYVEPLLTINLLPPHVIVFLWTSLKQNFLRHNL